MKHTLEYKSYRTFISYDNTDCSYYGKIEGINDLVTFYGNDLQEIKTEFISAVDDYLEFCEHVGKQPDCTYVHLNSF